MKNTTIMLQIANVHFAMWFADYKFINNSWLIEWLYGVLNHIGCTIYTGLFSPRFFSPFNTCNLFRPLYKIHPNLVVVFFSRIMKWKLILVLISLTDYTGERFYVRILAATGGDSSTTTRQQVWVSRILGDDYYKWISHVTVAVAS